MNNISNQLNAPSIIHLEIEIEILINIHRASSTYYLYTDLNVKLFLNQAKYIPL